VSKQVKKLIFLNEAIAECAAFRSTPKDMKLVIPTGDGMAIGFLQGPELPIKLAMELHEKITGYNAGRLTSESIQVRIGIHSGTVFMVNDVYGNNNIWGPGIILARRIMDLGDDGHVLLSAHVAKDLIDLSDEYGRYFHPLGLQKLKHDLGTEIYSAFSTSGNIFGNKNTPKKISPTEPKLLYPYIQVNLSILNMNSMLVHHKRKYVIQNASNKEISGVTHQIATDVEKDFEELKLKVYDDEGNKLATRYLDNKPHQKEFATYFIQPLREHGRKEYTLEYELEEPKRYFENQFFTDCKKFDVNITYPAECKIGPPKAYEVNTETAPEQKTEHDRQPSITKQRDKMCATWSEIDIAKGRVFRFEW